MIKKLKIRINLYGLVIKIQMDTLYNLNYLYKISDGDEDFIMDMLRDFIVNTPETLSEVKIQIDACNYEEIYKIVHRFIPSFDYVGAECIKDKLRIIETYSRQKEKIEQILKLFDEIKNESIELNNNIKKDFKILA
jgi:hypothetical protein